MATTSDLDIAGSADYSALGGSPAYMICEIRDLIARLAATVDRLEAECSSSIGLLAVLREELQLPSNRQAALLMRLGEANGSIVGYSDLARAMRREVGAEQGADLRTRRLIQVYMVGIRRSLATRGFPAAVCLHHGTGYSIGPQALNWLRIRLGAEAR